MTHVHIMTSKTFKTYIKVV